jgi:hypothetical protein
LSQPFILLILLRQQNTTIDIDTLALTIDEESDSAIKNIGSSDLVSRWAEKAKLRDKLIGYPDPERKSFLDKLLSVRPPRDDV